MKKAIACLLVLAIILFAFAWYFYSQGRDKVTNYYNSDYSSLSKNAYVGGDAYNYIINGNYSTGYYVLSMGFFLSAVFCVCSSAIIGAIAPLIEKKRFDQDAMNQFSGQ